MTFFPYMSTRRNTEAHGLIPIWADKDRDTQTKIWVHISENPREAVHVCAQHKDTRTHPESRFTHPKIGEKLHVSAHNPKTHERIPNPGSHTHFVQRAFTNYVTRDERSDVTPREAFSRVTPRRTGSDAGSQLSHCERSQLMFAVIPRFLTHPPASL